MEVAIVEKMWFRTGEVGQMLGVTSKTIREWIESGKIKAIRIGKEYRIHRSEVKRLLKEHNISEDILQEWGGR